MKEISQDIATKASVDLEIEVTMDGETIIKRQSDSVVGNFLRLLYGMFGRRGSGDYRRYIARTNNSNFRDINQSDPNSIDWINFNKSDTTNPPRMRVDNRIYFFEDNPVYIYTNIPEMCGLYYSVGNDHEFDLYHVADMNPRTGNLTKGDPADWSGVDRTNWNGKLWFREFQFKSSWRRIDTFNHPSIRLGKNKSHANSQNQSLDNFCGESAVGVEDQYLHMWIRDLSGTGTTRSDPAVGTNDSEITLSRTFTNNQSYSIDVGEIGVECKENNYHHALIARDIITPFTISTDSSVTVDYTLTISNDGGGGMMSQFHQLLYRQFRSGQRNVRDINNNDQSGDNGGNAAQFVAASLGGDQDQSPYGAPSLGSDIGPVPGISTNALANTNVSLGGDPSNADGKVPHGQEDDELYYSSAMVEDFHTDAANNEVWFDCYRLMENRGSTTITVRETGMYVGSSNNDNREEPRYAVMISRHILGSTVDVAPGEILKLRYRFKVVV